MITLRTALAYLTKLCDCLCNETGWTSTGNESDQKNGDNLDVPPYPSICLGVFDASVYDMTGAYSVFANHGIWTEPTFILRIEDKKGNVLYTHKPRVSAGHG